MLAKLTRGNQFTIPKLIIQKAQLQAGRDYLEVVYFNGVIVLKPVEIKARVAPKAYEALIKEALSIKSGDIVADEHAAESTLRKRLKKR